MVIAQVQSDDHRHPPGAASVPSGFLRRVADCVSPASHDGSPAAGIAGRGTVPFHAATAQELMALDVVPRQRAAHMSSCQNHFRPWQRIENARWQCRPLKIAPMVCRNRSCRTMHRHCIVDIMVRTAQLVRQNQMLQRRITELQRETDMFLKTVPARSPQPERESSSDEDNSPVENTPYTAPSPDCTRSPSRVDIIPPTCVQSQIDD